MCISHKCVFLLRLAEQTRTMEGPISLSPKDNLGMASTQWDKVRTLDTKLARYRDSLTQPSYSNSKDSYKLIHDSDLNMFIKYLGKTNTS